MDIGLFLGRFHPLVVHLPIGFLLLAAIFEGLSRIRKFTYLGDAVSITLLLGAISALLSVIFGFLIAGDRGYDDSVLFWHRWLGITVTVCATLIWLFRSGIIKVSGKVMIGLFVVLILFVSITGHLGGTLTHGDGYLTQYAPSFIQKLAGEKKKISLLANLPVHPDSVVIYRDIIDPIMQASCMPCHSQTQKKGGLSLVNFSNLMEGGENGTVVTAGKAIESELFRRITLPATHTKFMPLKETPLSFAEVNLIEWWINTGAGEQTILGELQIPEYLGALMLRDFDYDVTPKPYYEITKALKIDNQLLQEVASTGLKVRELSKDNHYLDVTLAADEKIFTQTHLDALLKVKDNITWLELNGRIKDGNLVSGLSQFENLTRLNIGNNELEDSDIASLSMLKHLESLNLYGTNLTDKGLADLTSIKSLKRIYAWQTEITEDAVLLAQKENPQLEVVQGYQFNTAKN